MKCSNCGGELIFKDNIGVCSNCNSKHKIESAFENTEVCICYIENDANGRRSKDSIIAAEVYKKLESKKISTFYERISVANAIGDDLQALRHSALFNAKILVLVGTNTENFATLYEKYASQAKDKKIIPVISDMKPEQLPDQLKRYQASNFDAIGALNDLSVSVLNLLGRSEEIELEEIYNKKAKRKKILTVVLCSLLALIVCAAIALAVIFGPEKEEPVVITDNDIYVGAVALLEEGKYLDAAAEFHKIPEYKDSSNQLKKIFDRYDGYYMDEDQIHSLYLNIIDGTTVELVFEETVDNKIIKIEESYVLDGSKASGTYIDSFDNEGTITVTLSDDKARVTATTSVENGKVSVGDTDVKFPLDSKSDRPLFKTVSKKMILGWMNTLTYVDDIKATGIELEYIDTSGPYDMSFGTQYMIANTDIKIITTNMDMSQSTGTYIDDQPELKDNAVVAVIAPISLICPDKIGQSACVFTKDDIVYVPNAYNMTPVYREGSDMFFNLDVEGDSPTANSTESRTMSETVISDTSTVGITSKKIIGEYRYNCIVNENKNIYYISLALEQYRADNPDTSETHTVIKVLAENSNAILINVHARELDGGLDTGRKGSFNYYRFDLSTHECTFITKHSQSSYINSYGSRMYDYEEWYLFPEYFGEFM